MLVRRSGAAPVLLLSVAIAMGLLLMHGGFDPAVSGGHHVGIDHHGSGAAPVGDAPGDGDAHGALGALAGICAVFAVVAVAAATWLRRPGSAAPARGTPGAPTGDVDSWLAATSPSRVSLCVERC